MADPSSEVIAAARAALGTLVELVPTAEREADDELTVPLDWFHWLDQGLSLFHAGYYDDPGTSWEPPDWADKFLASSGHHPIAPTVSLDRKFGERLAAVQQLRETASVQAGWLWVTGTADIATSSGKTVRRRVFLPLITRPVRVVRAGPLGGGSALSAYSDLQVTSRVTDRDAIRRFEQVETGGGAFHSLRDLTPELLARLTRLRSYAIALAAAAGLPSGVLTTECDQPSVMMRQDGLTIVIGVGVFALNRQVRATRATQLRSWKDDALATSTAFHAVYGGPNQQPPLDDAATPIESPLELTPHQEEVVRRSRSWPITVVSGAPGTGKSHTLAAVVADVLTRRESVLVTAKTDAAVDALIDLLDRQPGITPVVFGASERRDALARRLASGGIVPAGEDEIAKARLALDDAIAVREAARRRLVASLRPEELRSPGAQAERRELERAAPAAFSSALPHDLILVLIRQAAEQGDGWRRNRRRRRAERELRSVLGTPSDVALSTSIDAYEIAQARFSADGDSLPATRCVEWEAAASAARARLTEWIGADMRAEHRLGRTGLAAIAALGTALRSGRAARRAQLEQLRTRDLTSALPLWMGTLGDVDDLLPPVAGLFDVVLVDESASIEQTLAAAALLRARRVVMVGDPQQLRHVSFLSDETISKVHDWHALQGPQRVQLDVRRNSLYDAAAAAAPVIMLDEHFRSAPHLIDVVARGLYDGRLKIATRTPLTEQLDCVHLVQVMGTRDDKGVIEAETRAIVMELLRLRHQPSVGVITPFRAQAEALEDAILAAFSAEHLEAMDLRVGTVHSFQGHERDIVLCSLGLDEGGSAASFVQDPHLLAVMLTRARKEMRVFSSFTPNPQSLLGQYLAQADSPPGPPPPAGRQSPWANAVVAALTEAGVAAQPAYPVGRHVVDVATVSKDRPVAVICGLHPDGIDAHINRHAALLRGGWLLVDALESRWGDRLAAATIELAYQLQTGTLA